MIGRYDDCGLERIPVVARYFRDFPVVGQHAAESLLVARYDSAEPPDQQRRRGGGATTGIRSAPHGAGQSPARGLREKGNAVKSIVIDLWFRGNGERKPRHGVGKRWRARYVDDAGRERTQAFVRKADAKAWLGDVAVSLATGT